MRITSRKSASEAEEVSPGFGCSDRTQPLFQSHGASLSHLHPTNPCLTSYDEMSNIPRPSHGDFTYQEKYGIRASSGGGRSSARETVGRVRVSFFNIWHDGYCLTTPTGTLIRN